MNEPNISHIADAAEPDRKQTAISTLVGLLNEVPVGEIEHAIAILQRSKEPTTITHKKPTPPSDFTVAALRAAGCKLQVSHNRLLNPDLPFDEIASLYDRVVSDDLAVSRTGYLRQFTIPWGQAVATRGGVTEVELTTPNGQTVKGEAWCSKSDNYSRKDGVLYALGRAVVQLSEESLASLPILAEAAAYWKVELAPYLARLEAKRAKYLENDPAVNFLKGMGFTVNADGSFVAPNGTAVTAEAQTAEVAVAACSSGHCGCSE